MKTILIVEDDKTLRENIQTYLSEVGFNIVTAEDGLDGIQKTIKNLPDLILCDINMPGMNGYDFFKTIQQINYTSLIPFIFLTAKAEKDDIRTGMHMGVDDYITKPFDFNELIKVINLRIAKYEKIQKINDEKFNALAKAPSIGVYIYQNNKMVYYNEALAKIFGFTYEEFERMGFDESFEQLITDDEGPKVIEALNKCIIDTSSKIQIEFNCITKNSDEITVEMFGTVINYRGISSVIGNITDLSKAGAPHKKASTTLDIFTKREIEIINLVCSGLTTNEISEKLFISNRTVDTHRANVLAKAGCKNAAELINYAIKNNITGS